MSPLRGPLLVDATTLATPEPWATDWGPLVVPASLRTKWAQAVARGWSAQVIYVRAVALDNRGEPKFVERKEPLFDEGGNRMLTAKGTPRNTRVKTAEPLVEDTFNLIAHTRWEGAPRELTALWMQGKFAWALMRQPLLRLSATEVSDVLRHYGAPPARQAGVPLSLEAERAIRAARKEEESDDDDDE